MCTRQDQDDEQRGADDQPLAQKTKPDQAADLQPPLPLQVFLPLQPLSPVLQPPWPLQEFLPEQSCLLESESAANWPFAIPS